MGWKEKEVTGDFTPRDNVDALHMVFPKMRGPRGVKEGFGKECVATQSRMMPPEELPNLRREITKDVLDRVAFVLQKMGAPTIDMANMIVED